MSGCCFLCTTVFAHPICCCPLSLQAPAAINHNQPYTHIQHTTTSTAATATAAASMQLATRPQHVSFPFPHCHHSPLAAQLRPLACPTRHAHWSLGFSSGQQANELPLLNSRRSSSGSSSRNHSRTRAHRTAVTLQQHQQHQQHRPPSPPGQHHGQHHRHQLRDDGSLKVGMLHRRNVAGYPGHRLHACCMRKDAAPLHP